MGVRFASIDHSPPELMSPPVVDQHLPPRMAACFFFFGPKLFHVPNVIQIVSKRVKRHDMHCTGLPARLMKFPRHSQFWDLDSFLVQEDHLASLVKGSKVVVAMVDVPSSSSIHVGKPPTSSLATTQGRVF